MKGQRRSHHGPGPRARYLATATCQQCGKAFEKQTFNPTQLPKFCSPRCRGEQRQPGETLTEMRRRHRERDRAFVAEINARTGCVVCGAQPVEWHNPEHVELNRQAYRISALVQGGRPLGVIQAEMDRCTPLCRRCHMIEDDRLSHFHTMAREPKPIAPLRPCKSCGKPAKPLRRELCNACEGRRRYYLKTADGENVGAVERRRHFQRQRKNQEALA